MATDTRTATPEAAEALTVRTAVLAGAGGFAGMLAMTPFLGLMWLAGATSPAAWGNFADLLLLGNSPTIGFVIFVGGGATTFPLLFLSLKEYLPGRTTALRGIVFASVMWTGFAPGYYTGQAGADLVIFLLLGLAAHWAYGAVLGTVVERTAPAATV